MTYFIIALVVVCVAGALLVMHFSRERLKEHGDLIEKVKQTLDSQNKLTEAVTNLVEEIRKDRTEKQE